MVTIVPAKKKSQRTKIRPAVSAPPAVALVLAAASAAIDDDSAAVTLQFDRAIDVLSMDVTAIQVGTISTGNLYQGTDGPIVVDSKTVKVNLVAIDTYPESNVELFADAGNGIVAADDGGTWNGTEGTGLPFP